MNIFSKTKVLTCSFIFSFAFSIATKSIGLFCLKGLMEEPDAPEALLKR